MLTVFFNTGELTLSMNCCRPNSIGHGAESIVNREWKIEMRRGKREDVAGYKPQVTKIVNRRPARAFISLTHAFPLKRDRSSPQRSQRVKLLKIDVSLRLVFQALCFMRFPLPSSIFHPYLSLRTPRSLRETGFSVFFQCFAIYDASRFTIHGISCFPASFGFYSLLSAPCSMPYAISDLRPLIY